MTDLFQNNTVIVTGAASGIGKAVSLQYSKRGYQVIGLDINSTYSDYPIIHCDIGSEKSVDQAFEQIKERCSSISYLINCAGIFFSGHRSDIEEMTLDDWNSVLQINLTGTMLVTKSSIPLLKKAHGDRGIVFVSSDQATHPRSKNSAYAVSKGGIETLTKLCAAELLDDKIRVNAVAPASVRSNFIQKLAHSKDHLEEIYRKQNERMPLGLIEADDIAEIVLFLGTESAKRITGQIMSIDSGLYLKG